MAIHADEVAELQTLLAQAKTAGNRRDLEQLLHRKQKALEVVEVVSPPPQTVLAPVTTVGGDVATFSEIGRFGWEDEGYGKDKVAVYVMSGIDGVGLVPKENVTCDFTKTSFDLKILGLNGKNYRLFKQPLDKEIDPTKSSFRVKKNRVAISLHKVDKNAMWTNLTAKNPLKTSKPDTSDPSASIMDMMKNMYDEGDDEMKSTISKAWYESRNKTGAAASPF
ncbi:unnamed protein product [Hyaloperonospora brassicae]|uniref:Calcyclin-binding protein n=1 Tax=Hyaloperonospora brassicae TaxID=162125 RepID=A0AAV0UDB6_HYABA|nr:unnamed protein product [Hyaloperonospora brassicae]